MSTDKSQARDMPKSNSLMIAIIGTSFDPWRSVFEYGQCKTWLRNLNLKCEVLYLTCKYSGLISRTINRIIEFLRWNSGKKASYAVAYTLMYWLFPFRGIVPTPMRIREDAISDSTSITYLQIRCPEMLTALRWKKISMLRYFLRSGASYLLFVNPSTYVSIKNLEQFIQTKTTSHQKYVYAGHIANSADSQFVVGSFILLNRNTAELLLKGRFRIPTHTLDDVAFGKFLADCKVEAEEIETLTISQTQDLARIPDSNIVNFRIKVPSVRRVKDEITIMKHLETKLP